MGAVKEEDRFIQAKSDLLAHYSSQQTSMGARLVSSAVVLFALLQATNSNILHLFPNLGPLFDNIPPSTAFWEFVKLVVFIFLVTTLIAFMLYTIGRFSVFAQFSQEVMYVPFDDVEKWRNEEEVKKLGRREALHYAIHVVAWNNLSSNNPGLLRIFRVRWFVSTGEGSETRKGWARSIVVGVILALVLTWLLW